MTRKYSIKIFIGVCAVLIVIAFYQVWALEKNFKVTTGTVEYLTGVTKGGGTLVRYHYVVNGTTYNQSCAIINSGAFPTRTFSFLEGKTLNVVYEKNSPAISKMLFRRKDYVKYKIQTIDSILLLVDRLDRLINE